MTQAEKLFDEIADSLASAGVTRGALFGKPSLKIGGTNFSCFFKGAMVFKLDPGSTDAVLALGGAKRFDPSGSGRPMKQWIQVPFEHADRWPELADDALRTAVASSGPKTT